MKETSKAYMAGLMDADGTFTITSCIHTSLGHRLYDPTIACTSTYRPTLKWAVKNFGGTIYNHKITATSKLPRFDWVTQNYAHSSKFLMLIQPYILQKHRQVDVLQKFYSLYRQQCPEKRQGLYDKIVDLNAQIPVTSNTQAIWKQNLVNAYFAGFFDGESSVGFTNNGTSSRIEIGNTNLPLLETMKSLYSGRIYPLAGDSRPSHRKLMWNWVLCKREDVESFLLKMIPYLKTKRDASCKLLNFLRSK